MSRPSKNKAASDTPASPKAVGFALITPEYAIDERWNIVPGEDGGVLREEPARYAERSRETVRAELPKLAYRDDIRGAWLYHGDCLDIMDKMIAHFGDKGKFDMIFADPPYFLSNGGISCHAGRMVKVDKGDWDKSQGPELNHEFNRAWLDRCQKLLKPNGTLWVTGTHHVIHSIGFAMQQLGFKLLNDISWEKPNPPPNLSCRYFTHSVETIIWAAKNEKSRHVFNYEMMKAVDGKQMKTVWRIPPPVASEKQFGKHPTQKPVELIRRIITASTEPGALILDPFCGSATTGVAALCEGRKFVGVEQESDFITLSAQRLKHF